MIKDVCHCNDKQYASQNSIIVPTYISTFNKSTLRNNKTVQSFKLALTLHIIKMVNMISKRPYIIKTKLFSHFRQNFQFSIQQILII